MKNDNLSFQGLKDIASAIHETVPPNLIAEYQTLIAGVLALLAALITAGIIWCQIIQQKKTENKRYLEKKLAILIAHSADLESIIIACNEYVSKLALAVMQGTRRHAAILVPLQSVPYVEILRNIGNFPPSIANDFCIFYNALPIYEGVMKGPINFDEMTNDEHKTRIENLAGDLRSRTEKLRNSIKPEIELIKKQLQKL